MPVSILLSGFLACLLLFTLQAARADVYEPTPTLPPTVGGYAIATECASVICLVFVRLQTSPYYRCLGPIKSLMGLGSSPAISFKTSGDILESF